MKAIPALIHHFRQGMAGVIGGGNPPQKYRVTPRHNPFAFRRALLREAMIQLKRMPVGRPVTVTTEESDWR